LKFCFLLYPFYCPLTPPFPFSLEKAPASQEISSNNVSEPTLLWGTGHYYCRGVINLFTKFTVTRNFLFTDKNYFVWTSKYFRKYCHKN
jgi:hypothetical protein